MAPLNVEFDNSFANINNNKVAGYLVPETNIGFICKTTEDGGVVSFRRKTEESNKHNYETIEVIRIKKGDKPKTINIKNSSTDTTDTDEAKKIKATITAF